MLSDTERLLPLTPGSDNEYLFSGNNTNADYIGRQQDQLRQNRELGLDVQNLQGQLAKEQIHGALDALNDPTMKQIEAEKKNAALEELLPIDPKTGQPESRISMGVLPQDPGTRAMFPNLTIEKGPGTTPIMPRYGAYRAQQSSPDFQIASNEAEMRQLEDAITQADREANGVGIDKDGNAVPLSMSQRMGAAARSAQYKQRHEYLVQRNKIFNPAYAKHELYAPDKMGFDATGGGTGGTMLPPTPGQPAPTNQR